MPALFFKSIFKSLLRTSENLPKLDGSDFDSESLMDKLEIAGLRMELACEITPVIRGGLNRLNPFAHDFEKIDNSDASQSFFKPDPDRTSYVVDTTGRRILSTPPGHELAIPFFEISENFFISLRDIRGRNESAVWIGFAGAIARFAAQERVLYEALMNSCSGEAYKKYLFSHIELTIIPCDQPQHRAVGYCMFKSMGLAVTAA